MSDSFNASTKSKIDRLRRLQEHPNEQTTQDDIDLTRLAIAFATRYNELKDKDARKITNKIAELALDALQSNEKKVTALKHWFEWFELELGDDDTPPLTLEMSVLSLVDRKLQDVKDASERFRHNACDLPQDSTVTDARVIDEGSMTGVTVEKGGVFSRRQGAQISGVPHMDRGPLLGVVHNAARGTQYNIKGKLEEHMGMTMGNQAAPAVAAT